MWKGHRITLYTYSDRDKEVPKSITSSMESPPSVEETVACIANLYHNPNAEEKSQANQWLQILQNSVFAWKVRESGIEM